MTVCACVCWEQGQVHKGFWVCHRFMMYCSTYRVAAWGAASSNRISGSFAVTSVAKVCYEHNPPGHVCAHTYTRRCVLRRHPTQRPNYPNTATQRSSHAAPGSLPLLYSLSHFPPPSKFNLTHEKDAGKMASLGRPPALRRHTRSLS